MTQTIAPKPGVDQIKPYKGGESRLPGHDSVLKLSSNENPYGTSDAAREALRRTALSLHRYPSSNHQSLRNAIGDVHGLDADRIICGAGSDEVLTFLCQAFAGEGAEVIHTEHGFSLYPVLIRASGATPVKVAEAERRVDTRAILDAVTEHTRMVLLTNPGNPTGTLLDNAELAALADDLPTDVLLVLDGAYAEFAEGFDGGAEVVTSRENVVMTRTFSKLYGLGGLRVGWGYGSSQVVEMLNRVRGPFNLSETQLATAEAALRDREFAEYCLKENARMRDWLAAALGELGVNSDPSHGNFILARFQSDEEAGACDAALRASGIIVRRVAGYGFPEALRITIGTEADCRQVVAAIAAFKELAA